LVDGDIDTVAMYTEYLSRAPFAIEQAADGREALAKAIARPPDVVVTETRLPGIDGYELITLLRRDHATRSVRIVVVTADAFPAQIARAETLGADSVLVKPCLPERLLGELQRILARSRELQQRAQGIRTKLVDKLARADRAIQHSLAVRNQCMSHALERYTTINPEDVPPQQFCPQCARPLAYLRSHLGGVSARFPEQWDDFECRNGCGTFQYRHRTNKLRRA
jgi:DNA-binding response OmpR family regulator